jgi:hypothetical protein
VHSFYINFLNKLIIFYKLFILNFLFKKMIVKRSVDQQSGENPGPNNSLAEPSIKTCNCNCPSCDVCGNKNFNDIIMESISKMIDKLGDLTKRILGFVFSLVATLINCIIFYVSFPGIKTWKAFYMLNIFGSILDVIPTEAYITLGFTMCCLSNYLNVYVGIGLTMMLALTSLYWAYANGQWLALAASAIMFFYALMRTGVLEFLPDYILGMFRYTSFVVIGLLASNLTFNIYNNLNLAKKNHTEF